jgi:hypothetical protein
LGRRSRAAIRPKLSLNGEARTVSASDCKKSSLRVDEEGWGADGPRGHPSGRNLGGRGVAGAPRTGRAAGIGGIRTGGLCAGGGYWISKSSGRLRAAGYGGRGGLCRALGRTLAGSAGLGGAAAAAGAGSLENRAATVPLANNGAEAFGEVFRHELNNPLTGILGNAELLLAEVRRKNDGRMPQSSTPPRTAH